MNAHRVLSVLLGLLVMGPSLGAQSDTLRLYSRHDVVPLDPNGFLLNPAWLNAPKGAPDIEDQCRFRVGTFPLDERRLFTTSKHRCLSHDERNILTLNETGSTLGFGFICATNNQIGLVRGHVNWFPVTVTGKLFADKYSGETPNDGDFNFNLAPPNPSAVTSGNGTVRGRRVLHLELNHAEVFGIMGANDVGWWYAVSRAKRREPALGALVHDRFAVVTGLYGLDGVHDFQAELHPVFSMVVLIDTMRTNAGTLREEWAVLVRNRGNQGECAGGSHAMVTSDDSVQHFAVDLGVWPHAGTPVVRVAGSVALDTTLVPRWRTDATHLYVVFPQTRPGPAAASLFVGTLSVEWSRDGDGPPLERLKRWLPDSAGALKVSPVTPGTVVAADTVTPEITAPAGYSQEMVRVGRAERDSIGRMRERGAYRFRDRVLEPLGGWVPARDTLVDRNIPFPVPQPVDSTCAKTGPVPLTNPLCRPPWRGVLGVTTGPPFGFTGGVQFLAHGYLKTHVVNAFGYRLDYRTDTFRRKCDSTCNPLLFTGGSVHASAILASNSWGLGPLGRLSLYTIGGVGVSWLTGASRDLAWSIGFGGELIHGNSGGFVEASNYARKGPFFNYWTVNVGLVL